MFMRGEKCELAALAESDLEAFEWTSYVNRGDTTHFLLTGSYPMRPIDIKAVWEKERKAGSVELGIYANGRFVGTCGLYSHRDIYRSWEFRILIFNPDYIGKGIGEDATRMTVEYAFARLNAHRVWLGVNSENVGAIKCYEKVGFKREGVLREDIFCMGRYMDVIRMAVLENEWTSPTSVEGVSAPSATKN